MTGIGGCNRGHHCERADNNLVLTTRDQRARARGLFDLTMTAMLRGFEQSRLIAAISFVIASRSGRTRHVHVTKYTR